MSEPLSSHEIEDILSSVRRLVAADTPDASLAAMPANADAVIADTMLQSAAGGAAPLHLLPGFGVATAPVKAPAGKLLLTPDLRIVSKADDAAAAVVAEADKSTAADISTPLPEAVPEVSEDLSMGAGADQMAPLPPLLDPCPTAASSADRMPLPPPLGLYHLETPVFFGAAEPLGVATSPEVYDEDGVEEGGSGLKVVIDSLSLDGVEADAMPAAAKPALSLVNKAALRATVAEAMSAKLPDLDWMQSDEDWLDDAAADIALPFMGKSRGPATTADEPLAKVWADRAEAQIHAELREEPAAYTAAPSPNPPQRSAAKAAEPVLPPLHLPVEYSVDTSDLVLDEEQLRDLVRQMMREELQGLLGESITRNVRKLVRMEINRLLISRDFD